MLGRDPVSAHIHDNDKWDISVPSQKCIACEYSNAALDISDESNV